MALGFKPNFDGHFDVRRRFWLVPVAFHANQERTASAKKASIALAQRLPSSEVKEVDPNNAATLLDVLAVASDHHINSV